MHQIPEIIKDHLSQHGYKVKGVITPSGLLSDGSYSYYRLLVKKVKDGSRYRCEIYDQSHLDIEDIDNEKDSEVTKINKCLKVNDVIGIVTGFICDCHNGNGSLLYLIYQDGDAISLHDFVTKYWGDDPIPENLVIQIYSQLMDILTRLHQNDISYGFITPHHILIWRENTNSTDSVKVRLDSIRLFIKYPCYDGYCVDHDCLSSGVNRGNFDKESDLSKARKIVSYLCLKKIQRFGGSNIGEIKKIYSQSLIDLIERFDPPVVYRDESTRESNWTLARPSRSGGDYQRRTQTPKKTKLDGLVETNNQLTDENKRLIKNIKESNDKEIELKNKIHQLSIENSNYAEEKNCLKGDISKLSNDLDKIKQENTTLKKNLTIYESKIKKISLENQSPKLNNEIKEYKQIIESLNRSLDEYKARENARKTEVITSPRTNISMNSTYESDIFQRYLPLLPPYQNREFDEVIYMKLRELSKSNSDKLEMNNIRLDNKSDQYLQDLFQYIGNQHQITHLNFSQTNLGTNGLRYLMNSLETLPNIKYLNLSQNKFDKSSIMILWNYPQKLRQLKEFSLDSCITSNTEDISMCFGGLLYMMSYLPRLTRLNLANNSLDTSLLGTLSMFSNLSMLMIGDNPKIGDKGIKILSKSLTRLINIQILFLNNVNMTNTGYVYLLKSLKLSKTLQILDICGNNISVTDNQYSGFNHLISCRVDHKYTSINYHFSYFR